MPDMLFSLANMVALSGWAALLIGHFRYRDLAHRYAGTLVPLILATAYAGLVLAFWSSAEGGFSSLETVSTLFESRQMLLAGWLHYLAFDLFVGAWIARVAAEEGVPFLLLVPALLLTFLFGPAGYLAFQMLRFARSGAPRAITR